MCACLNNLATDELLETADEPYAEEVETPVEADSNLANMGKIAGPQIHLRARKRPPGMPIRALKGRSGDG